MNTIIQPINDNIAIAAPFRLSMCDYVGIGRHCQNSRRAPACAQQ
jgi:hypothetical protein